MDRRLDHRDSETGDDRDGGQRLNPAIGVAAGALVACLIPRSLPWKIVTPAAGHTTAIALEAVRRVGVAVYPVAVAPGLAAITDVFRFQAIRLRELPGQTGRA